MQGDPLDDTCVAHLVWVDVLHNSKVPDEKERIIHIFQTPITLGRMGCDITLDSKSRNLMVSRKHASFHIKTTTDYKKQFVVVDTSTNGTIVNGERIKAEYSLKEGDILQFGSPQSDCTYKFHWGKQPQQQEAPVITPIGHVNGSITTSTVIPESNFQAGTSTASGLSADINTGPALPTVAPDQEDVLNKTVVYSPPPPPVKYISPPAPTESIIQHVSPSPQKDLKRKPDTTIPDSPNKVARLLPKYKLHQRLEAKCQKVGVQERQAWFDAEIVEIKQKNGYFTYKVNFSGYDSTYDEELPEQFLRPNSNGEYDWNTVKIGVVKHSNGWWYDAVVEEKLANPHVKGNKRKKCLSIRFVDLGALPPKKVEYNDVFVPVLHQ